MRLEIGFGAIDLVKEKPIGIVLGLEEIESERARLFAGLSRVLRALGDVFIAVLGLDEARNADDKHRRDLSVKNLGRRRDDGLRTFPPSGSCAERRVRAGRPGIRPPLAATNGSDPGIRSG